MLIPVRVVIAATLAVPGLVVSITVFFGVSLASGKER